MIELITDNPVQYLIYLGISIVAWIFVGILYFRDSLYFQFFLGKVNPLGAIISISLLGFVLLSVLLSRGWLAIYERENLRGILIALGLGALFGLVMVLVDLRVVFPDDLNKSYPESLLFYPAMGYVVEILFHVLPVTLLLVAMTSLSREMSFEKVILPCIFLISLLEPVYQTKIGFSRQYPVWVTGYVALHIYLINLCQLLVFRRYDFVSMFSLRLSYYIIWHILWGYLRLKILF
jgi:hypothetical protein